jgi:hypothetical protein
MKRVINGSGVDTTDLVLSWLATHTNLYLATLYLIGDADNPDAIKLTDWSSPLYYAPQGVFQSTNIERGSVESKIGLEVPKLEILWRPAHTDPTQSAQTASYYQKAAEGFYDNWPVYIWSCYMPTPGDAATFGCSELFSGLVGDIQAMRGEISIEVASILHILNRKVPAQVVEITNPTIATKAATPPAGMSEIPVFSIIAGGTNSVLYADCVSPSAHHIFTEGTLHNGFIIFKEGASATLAKRWSAIMYNKTINIAGTNYNEISLYEPLPWPPTPGVDQFYLSGEAPINFDDGDYYGFPYVPNAEQGF